MSEKRDPRIAIFHDYFGAIGGGEVVALQMAKCLGADIITTDTDAAARIDPSVRVISLGKTVKFPPLKQISAALRFRFCDYADDYDLFIFTGNWSHMAAARHRPNLWYCYTPVRAFYDLYPVFLSRQGFFRRQLFRVWVFFHRGMDRRSLHYVDRICAISQNVRERIRRYYGREACLLYPPIETAKYRFDGYGDFWLSVNRLYPEKRIELQIEAFRRLPEEKLVIAGGFAPGDHAAGYAERIRHNLPPNVALLGEIGQEELVSLYARCRGHLCTAIDEDFGLTPLEAMASGKAVVAVDEGGFRETIVPGTGILVSADSAAIAEAVRTISRDPARYREACLSRSRMFDLVRFRELLIAQLPARESTDKEGL